MDTASQAIVIQRTIEGVPTRTIGEEIGVSHASVVRARQRPDVKARVESGIIDLINRGVRPAVRTVCRLAAEGNKSIDKDMLKLSLDASKVILSHVYQSGPQTVINTLININQSDDASPQVLALQGAIDAQWYESNKDESIGIPPSSTTVFKP